MKSEEAILLLVRLVNAAQKRGAYNIEESYLAFNAMESLSNNESLKKLKQLVADLDMGKVTLMTQVNQEEEKKKLETVKEETENPVVSEEK
tara:strand:+ start:1161 stop:1433 length:273 start_codon:yes stop_codon:yes gene_type:complete